MHVSRSRFLIGIIVAVAAALLGYWTLREPAGQPAAPPGAVPTPTASSSPAITRAEPPPPAHGTATPSPPASVTATASATASAVPRPPQSAGAVVVEDPGGDLVDTAGTPATDPQPAGDLRRVSVSPAPAAPGLVVRFEVAGPVPDTADTIVWSVQLRGAGGQPGATISAQLLGARRLAAIDDWQDQEQTPVELRVDGATLSLTVPADLLTGLPEGATWSALTQVDEAFEDRAGAGAPVPALAAGG